MYRQKFPPKGTFFKASGNNANANANATQSPPDRDRFYYAMIFLYKTRMCPRFVEDKSCPYGDDCFDSHSKIGFPERRTPFRNNGVWNYGTDKCLTGYKDPNNCSGGGGGGGPHRGGRGKMGRQQRSGTGLRCNQYHFREEWLYHPSEFKTNKCEIARCDKDITCYGFHHFSQKRKPNDINANNIGEAGLDMKEPPPIEYMQWLHTKYGDTIAAAAASAAVSVSADHNNNDVSHAIQTVPLSPSHDHVQHNHHHHNNNNSSRRKESREENRNGLSSSPVSHHSNTAPYHHSSHHNNDDTVYRESNNRGTAHHHYGSGSRSRESDYPRRDYAAEERHNNGDHRQRHNNQQQYSLSPTPPRPCSPSQSPQYQDTRASRHDHVHESSSPYINRQQDVRHQQQSFVTSQLSRRSPQQKRYYAPVVTNPPIVASAVAMDDGGDGYEDTMVREHKSKPAPSDLLKWLAFYKTKECRYGSDCRFEKSCEYYHSGSDRRRYCDIDNPDYFYVPCDALWDKKRRLFVNDRGGGTDKPKQCPSRDECPLAHNFFEIWFHPNIYRTLKCPFLSVSKQCNGKCPWQPNDENRFNPFLCCHYHNTSEKRIRPDWMR